MSHNNAGEQAGGDPDREVFADGNMSEVVSYGDTVERRMGPWSAASHAVLRHLESVGFRGAPRLLGIEGDRELLTFIKGESAPADLVGFMGDGQLAAVAALIKDLHDAFMTFTPAADLAFPRMPGAPDGSCFVCHNDLAPWNTIFRDGQPVAFIDWDLVAPAPPEWDLAYAAWRFIPLYPDDATYGDAASRGQRLRMFLDGYRLDARQRDGFVSIIRQRQVSAYETVEQWGKAGVPGFARLFDQRLHVGGLDDIAWLDANGSTLQEAIVT